MQHMNSKMPHKDSQCPLSKNLAQKGGAPQTAEASGLPLLPMSPSIQTCSLGPQCSQHSHTHPTSWRELMVRLLPGQSRFVCEHWEAWGMQHGKLILIYYQVRRAERKMLASTPLHCNNMKICTREDTEGQGEN